MDPQVNVLTQNTMPEAKQKSGCFKKLLLGLLIFIVSVIILVFLAIFIVPKILSMTAKDIPPIDDKDILPTTIKISDQDNAFVDLNGIENITYQPEVVLDYISLKKWDDNDIAQILDKNKAAFARWDSAAKKASFQDPFYQDSITPAPYQSGFPHSFSGYQKLARLSTLRGLSQIKQGSASAGLNTMFETLSIGQKIQHSNSGLIGHLFGTAIKNIGFQGLQTAASKIDMPPTISAAFRNQLAAYPYDTEGLKEGLRQEYFANAYLLDSIASGKIDKIYPPDSSDSATLALRNNIKSGVKNNYLFQPNKTKLLYANLFRSQIKNADSPCTGISLSVIPKKPLAASDIATLYFKQNGIGEVLFNAGATIFDGVVNSKCIQAVELNATELLFALRAYETEKGSLPTSLDQIVPAYIHSIPIDPHDGVPLKYSALNKIIYSIGKDKKDDGGKGKARDQTSPDYVIPINF